MSSFKNSIVTVNAAFNCLAYALIIAMARVIGEPKYQTYRDGKGSKKPVEDLLNASGTDLSIGGCFQDLRQFQYHISEYQIIVFDILTVDKVIFGGN